MVRSEDARVARTTPLVATMWVVIVVATAVGVAMQIAHREVVQDSSWGPRWTPGAWAVVFSTVGAVLATRVPRNPIGWLLVHAGVWSAVLYLASELDLIQRVTAPDPTYVAVWVVNNAWVPVVASLAAALILFPTGRPASRTWLAILWAVGAAAVVRVLLVGLAPVIYSDGLTEGPSPVASSAFDWITPSMIDVADTALQIALLPAVASLLARRRRADAVQRQQLRWLAWAIGVLILAILVVEIGGALGALTDPQYSAATVVAALAILLVPVTVGVAVLRYRLFDIDRVISRTLVYAVVTAVLAVTYLTIVLAVQALFSLRTDEVPDVVVAASTLGLAALFRPLRNRVQRLVDRRFNRRAYDAAATVDRFGQRLRGHVDLDSLRADLTRVVTETMQPARVMVIDLPPPSSAPPGA